MTAKKKDSFLREAVEAMKHSTRNLQRDAEEGEETMGVEVPMVMSDYDNKPLKRVSTGLTWLDYLLGGGYPMGRIIEVYGEEMTGKTALALQCIKKVTDDGGMAFIFDVERTIDVDDLAEQGFKLDRIIHYTPETLDEVFASMEALFMEKINGAEKDCPSITLIDTVASGTTMEELDGDYGQRSFPSQARVLSQGLRKIKRLIDSANTVVICNNQVRMNMGFGDPWLTPGGKALKFWSTIRLALSPAGAYKLTSSEDVAGILVKVKVIKNKTAPPLVTMKFPILFRQNGISNAYSLFEYLSSQQIIVGAKRKGSFELPQLGIPQFNRKEWGKIYASRAKEIEELFLATERSRSNGDIQYEGDLQPDKDKQDHKAGGTGAAT